MIRTRSLEVPRPPSFTALLQATKRSLRFGQSEALDWKDEEIIGPNVEHRETLLELAKMTNNAYVAPDDPAWYELDEKWSVVSIQVYMNIYMHD